MSDAQIDSKPIIHKLPFVLKKNVIKSAPNSKYGFFRYFPGASASLIKEDIIFKTTDGDLFGGKYPDLNIVNRFDLVKNSSRTIASYTDSSGSLINLSSDAVVQLIGQDNYDQVFASLRSIINQDLKIKGIFSLLCLNRVNVENKCSSVHTQTDDSSFTDLRKEKLRQKSKNYRRNKVRTYVVQPYEVKFEPVAKKIVVHPDELKNIKEFKVKCGKNNSQTELVNDSDTSCKDINIRSNTGTNLCVNDINLEEVNTYVFPDLKGIVDEDSNFSDNCSIGNLSIGRNFSFDIENNVKSFLNDIDEHIELVKHNQENVEQVKMSTIHLVDGSKIMVKGNPDLFHLAMPDILKDLSPIDKKKLMLHQAYIDWKFCLQRDVEDYLPIHLAVLNKDVEFLKRQCLMLKSRHETVDILAPGNMTALQMSICQDCPECTALLLAHGADVMVRDEESRTVLHLAAETSFKHVEAILTHCRSNARQILEENEELRLPDLDDKPDNKIISYLLTQLTTTCDNQGYTPLMLASQLGQAETVGLLVGAAPSAVDKAMPTSGNTALYLAASAACVEAADRGDKTNVPENYIKTIEFLVESGADPAAENGYGSNVTVLLADCHDSRLLRIIAEKQCAYNGYNFNKFDDYMLVKNDQGAINVAEVKKPKVYAKPKKTCIAEDVPLKDCVNAQDNTELVVKPDKRNEYMLVKHELGAVDVTEVSKRNVYTDPEITNTTEDKPLLECVNVKENTKLAVKLDTVSMTLTESTTSKKTDTPVILKKIPVVTRIVNVGDEKSLLVQRILPKGDKTNFLTTPIRAKLVCKTNVPPLLPLSAKATGLPFCRISPKNQSATSESIIIQKSALQPVPLTELIDPAKVQTVTKKTPIILRRVARKRPKHDNFNSEPSSSKIPKT